MDFIEIAPDPPTPAYLSIPPDAESVIPGRSLSAADLLRYEFQNPFWVPYNGTSSGVPAWSGFPPHEVCARLLLSCVVPRRGTIKQLLSELRRLSSTPQLLAWAAVSPCKTLPSHLPIWVLSFWDRLSEAYDARLSWRCQDPGF